MTIQVFDPPMCCPTGVCGPSVDPEVARFAADVAWLKTQGVEVERHNLSQSPMAFASHAVVMETLSKEGNDCLPLILVNDVVVCRGRYPTREELVTWAGIEVRTLVTDAVRELVAIGAAIGSNCEMCFRYHYREARRLGVSDEDIRLAVEMAQRVKEQPARSILALANRLLGGRSTATPAQDGCDGGPSCCG